MDEFTQKRLTGAVIEMQDQTELQVWCHRIEAEWWIKGEVAPRGPEPQGCWWCFGLQVKL